ncbi:hypothetical protein [Shewanella algae]|uniref:hypothetical protein n=1 Tax=Shewanella algae TaxID=38313 RepID=UPI0012DDC99E|nr:hypothetical protein [Shewanella algae]QGS61888.1 hypothetical protein GMX02_21625 [Shewanella algae]
MAKLSKGLDPHLVSLLVKAPSSGTTLPSLADAYEAQYPDHSHSSRALLRQWLCRRLAYMIKHGLVHKSKMGKESAVYVVTAAFKKMFIENQSEISKPNEIRETNINDLKRRLSQYHVDMLAYAGECKKYQLLVNEFPQLRSNIERMHQAAKDKSAELVGQIRAINHILQQSSQN